jgi:hypothetical protein
MYVTEEEALTKWCPMGKMSNHGTCIASNCMWWQWAPISTLSPLGIARRRVDEIEKRGYCGHLSGRL